MIADEPGAHDRALDERADRAVRAEEIEVRLVIPVLDREVPADPPSTGIGVADDTGPQKHLCAGILESGPGTWAVTLTSVTKD
jgi:hypothetical protein